MDIDPKPDDAPEEAWCNVRVLRSTHKLLQQRRERLAHVRELSMGQFLELLAMHGKLEEEDVRSFKPSGRRPGRPKRHTGPLSW